MSFSILSASYCRQHPFLWDGESHQLLGTAGLDLFYLLRRGQEAVQTTLELQVIGAGRDVTAAADTRPEDSAVR
jgi:hypothetical protein